VWRDYARYLWLVAAVVLFPLAVLELLGFGPAVDIRADSLDPAGLVVDVALVVVFELLAAEVVAAAAERMVSNARAGTAIPGVRDFLGRVPWLSLVVATVVYELAVAIGVLLLVVPGFVVLVFGALYGPVTVVERPGPVRALLRSAHLVRQAFWSMAAVMALGLLAYEAIALGVHLVLAPVSHDWSDVLGEYLASVLVTPLAGVTVAVSYYGLVDLEELRTSTTVS